MIKQWKPFEDISGRSVSFSSNGLIGGFVNGFIVWTDFNKDSI